MNWAQFKDPLRYLCLAGAVVAPCSLTREVEEFAKFIENMQGKLNYIIKNLSKCY